MAQKIAGGEGGSVGRVVREKAAFQLKVSPFRMVSFQQAGLRRSQGWREAQRQGRTQGALHLIQVQQSLVQHPLCTQVLLFGAFQFI